MIENLPPQNIEAEQALLGVLISNPDASIEILEEVKSTDFYDHRHRLLFEVISSMIDAGKKVDMVTIADEIKEYQLNDKIQFSYMAQIVNSTPSFVSGKQYAEIVRKKSQLRNIVTVSSQIAEEAYKDEIKLEQVTTLEGLMNGLNDNSRSKRVSVKEVMKDLEGEIKNYEDGKTTATSTGFLRLDGIVTGFIVPHIWIIGGFTGVGKTFFTLELLKNLMRGGMKPVLFSTENNKTRNLVRILSSMTGIHEMKLFKGNWTEEERILINAAKQELEGFNLHIYDNVFDTEELRLKAKKHKKQNGSNLIVVDYIQQLNTGSDIYQQMSEVSLQLQKIANELNMGVIGVSQVGNMEASNKDSSTLNFKGAGEIRAIADVAIGLRHTKDEDKKLIAEVVKVRHGTPGSIKFGFFGEDQKKHHLNIEESQIQ